MFVHICLYVLSTSAPLDFQKLGFSVKLALKIHIFDSEWNFQMSEGKQIDQIDGYSFYLTEFGYELKDFFIWLQNLA